MVMSKKTRLVAVTTIQYGSFPRREQKTRSEVFLHTARHFQALGIPLVGITRDCADGYIQQVRARGVRVVEQKGVGMGSARREAMRAGLSLFPHAEHYLWLEPEKPDIAWHAMQLSDLMTTERTVLGLFNRANMNSYPPEQAQYYLFCRAIATTLLKKDIDYAFGPMILTKQSMEYFLKYEGDYGDVWDSILIPRLRVMNAGLPISVIEIAFQNDPRMKKVESGQRRFIVKRINQVATVAQSLVEEWSKLRR